MIVHFYNTRKKSIIIILIKIEMNDFEKISCPKCGVNNNAIAKFCENCGFRFEELKDSTIEAPPEYGVAERKRFRVYSMFAVTIFFAVFFITLGVLLLEYGVIFIATGCLVICPLGALSTYGYFNYLRNEFSISTEEIKLQKTHSLTKITWGEFDILRVNTTYTEFTKFRIRCIDKIHNRTVQTFNFRFYNRNKAKVVLDLLKEFTQIKKKELKF